MSKKSKAKAKLKRLAVKRARKAARQAQYEAYKKAGQNQKSKRFRKGQSKKKTRNKRHPTDYCGNLACVRCFPEYNNPWLVSEDSCIYFKRFTSKKWRNSSPSD